MDGLLGVAGMITTRKLWIIPENSLRLAPVSYSGKRTVGLAGWWFGFHGFYDFPYVGECHHPN